MVLITWTINMDKIKWLSKNKKKNNKQKQKQKKPQHFSLELDLSRLRYPADDTVLEAEDHHIYWSLSLSQQQSMTEGAIFFKKKKEEKLDYVNLRP